MSNPTLENWSIIHIKESIFRTPNINRMQLLGQIYGDTRGYKDGVQIRTFDIVEFDLDNRIAKTLNTTYLLGRSHEEHLKDKNNEGNE